MIHKFLIALFAFSFHVCLAAGSEVPKSIEVVGAEFGIFDASDPREVVFEPTLRVPHRQGQRYGWVIEVKTTQRSLSVREEYLLSRPPKNDAATDAAEGAQNIPLERISQVSQRQLVPVDGKIYGEWVIGPDEPPGHRHLQVVIENRVSASFEFDVR